MTKELTVTAIGACLALAMLIGGITRCAESKMKALNACIEKTGKPIDCEAAFRSVGQ